MSYRLVTDSAAGLPDYLVEELGLTVLPLTFRVGDEEHLGYIKDEPYDLKQFYDAMRAGAMTSTSLCPLDITNATLREILEAGDDILYLGFSTGLSGMFQSVVTMAPTLLEDYPERTIRCVNTLAASLGEGLIVYLAAKKYQDGMGMNELAQWVEDNKMNVCHWFTVDDLMYLYRGGRVSRTSAFAGNLLKIKPVLHVDEEGCLIPMEKVRSRKKSLNALVDHMAETCTGDWQNYPVFISHGDAEEDALYVKSQIEERFGSKDFVVHYLDPVIGSHTGPGLIALFFMGEHR